jgi:hypothetical protein
MKDIALLTDVLKVSRPIFSLKIDRDGSRINAFTHRPIHQYRPLPEENNVLSELVVEHYRETFSVRNGEFTIDQEEIIKNVMSDMRRSIPKFLEKNLGMRSPTQSKIYRWTYRNLPETDYFNSIVISLYKYMRTFCDENMLASPGKQDHIKNTIALLEAMQEKYE